MRFLIGFFTLFFMTMLAVSAQATEPLVLYDDFNSEFMDIERWVGTERRGEGVIILEYVRELRRGHLEYDRELLGRCYGGRLHMMGRAFGSTANAKETRAGDVSSSFGAGATFQTLKVSVKVNDIEVAGCPESNPFPTSSRARLYGFFFNAGGVKPPVDDRKNDVLVQIRIQRRSDSSDKPGQLEVLGEAVLCTDSQCNVATGIGSAEELGKIMLGQWATIQIDWDKEGSRFIFKLNQEPSVAISYSNPVNYPPSSPYQALGVANRIANCPGGRKMGFIDAEFENLFVRELP